MIRGTFWDRLVRGTSWAWLSERHREALPADLPETVMGLDARDRLHAKQGRSTARVVFHSPSGPLPVYLKRHYRLPWRARLAALLLPGGRHTPGAAEWAHLERARAMGVAVPEVVAAGERIGPWGRLQSFLMVAELTGCRPLNEALPDLALALDPAAFAALKRALVVEMAGIAAALHDHRVFHKDLYLCHFFLDEGRVGTGRRMLSLIDLHRLREHRRWPDRWRWKDLGQLLFSTVGVPGISDRDRLRFWGRYRRLLGLRRHRWHLRMVRLKAARYLAHNRPRPGAGAGPDARSPRMADARCQM
jgi:heptose I phosphotransferase